LTTSFAIRTLEPGETALLRRMAYTAITWRAPTDDRPHPPMDEVLATQTYAPYVDGWGRPGDVGLVAVVDGRDVGGAWYRRFTAEVPGKGYVDDATPELGIGVFDVSHRGSGIGRALLTCLVTQARLAGLPGLSLAVSTGNPAQHLYAALGFSPHREVEGGLVMLLALAGHPSRREEPA